MNTDSKRFWYVLGFSITLSLVLTNYFPALACDNAASTSKTSYSDIQAGSDLESKLIMLEDHYGIKPFEGQKFDPEKAVTHLEFASKLSNTLESIQDITGGSFYAIEGLPANTRKTGNAKESLKKLESTKNNTQYYSVLKSLLKKHGVDLPSQLSDFKPDAPLKLGELTMLMGPLVQAGSPEQTITREAFAEILYCWLNKTETKIEESASSSNMVETDKTQFNCRLPKYDE